MKATYKGQEEERRHHIDLETIHLLKKKLFQIHSQQAKIYQKHITTYPGALGVYSFTFINPRF